MDRRPVPQPQWQIGTYRWPCHANGRLDHSTTSFCGIVGFKPSFGRVSREGAKIYAQSFDTVGWYGRSVADIALLASVLSLDERLEASETSTQFNIASQPDPMQTAVK